MIFQGNPKATGLTIAGIMIAIFVFIGVGTMRNLRENREVHDLKNAIGQLERSTVSLENWVAALEKEEKLLQPKIDEAGQLKENLDKAVARKAQLSEEIASLKNRIDAARAEAKGAYATLLASAKGKSFPSITTSSGRTYQSVQILAATPEGIRIQHAEGSATIVPKEVPSPIKEDYGYDLQRPFDFEQPARIVSSPEAPSAPAELSPPPPLPKTTPDIERNLLEQEKTAQRIASLRLQAQRLQESAEQYEAEANEHSRKASMARASGRSSMQDAEATRDRETARQLRMKADNALSEASRLERELRATP